MNFEQRKHYRFYSPDFYLAGLQAMNEDRKHILYRIKVLVDWIEDSSISDLNEISKCLQDIIDENE